MNPEKRSMILSNLLPTEHGRKLVAESLKSEINKNVGWRCLWRKALTQDEDWNPAESSVQSSTRFFVAEDGDIAFIKHVVDNLVPPVDQELVRLLSTGIEWQEYPHSDASQMLGDYEGFTKSHEGVVLMGARTFAWARRGGRDHLKVITKREVLLTGQMATFGLMNLLVSRVAPEGHVLFIPKGTGRYRDKLEVSFEEAPSEESPLSQWEAHLEANLEVDVSKVQGVKIIGWGKETL